MSTKVKGEAIKEGSIPLSALSNEVKDKIENAGGGADWNAQEGEPGYIENRTHFVQIEDNCKYVIENADSIEIPNPDYTDTVYVKFNDLRVNNPIFAMTVGDFDVYGQKHFKIVKLTDKDTIIGLLHYDSDCAIIVKYINGTLFLEFSSPVEIDTRRLLALEFYFGNEDDFRIIKIDDIYLPDTVIKTTPQTLSDVDKNQALTNIGIDPVVWRYICNPLRIQDGSYMLSELVNEGNFVVKAPNAYRFIDSLGHEYTPVEVGDTAMQVETPDGYVNLSLQYDSEREEYQIVKIL